MSSLEASHGRRDIDSETVLEAFTGFAVVSFAIALGYLIARTGILSPNVRYDLSRLTYFVLSPILLFVVLAKSDVSVLFSALLPVSALTAIVVIAGYVLFSVLIGRRSVGDIVIGALSAGQVNSNNIGIPLSLYLLGSAAFPAPVIMFQLLLLAPVALSILEIARTGRTHPRQIILSMISNPLIIGSALGALVSVLDLTVPAILFEPLAMVSGACVPVMLISYGMSLHGQRVLQRDSPRTEILMATVLKLIVMPAIAWLLAALVFRLSSTEILTTVVLASLPTAQNVFNYAQRFGVGESVSRDTIFLTTVGCIPVIACATALLG